MILILSGTLLGICIFKIINDEFFTSYNIDFNNFEEFKIGDKLIFTKGKYLGYKCVFLDVMSGYYNFNVQLYENSKGEKVNGINKCQEI